MKRIEETVHDIDIAGAVADRETDTVLAIGGSDHSCSVCLLANVNQGLNQLLEIDLAGEKKRKAQNLKIYTVMLYELIKSCPVGLSGVVVLDRDIDAKSLGRAKRVVKKLLKEDQHPKLKFRIEAGRVGKRSRAHEIANDVYSGRKSADLILTLEGCLEIMDRFYMS